MGRDRRKSIFAMMSKGQFAHMLEQEGPQVIRIKMRRTQGGPPREVSGMLTLATEDRVELIGDGAVAVHNSARLSDEERYRTLVEDTIATLGHADTTSRDELDALGEYYFGNRYAGTYARDEHVPLRNQAPYAIINTDPAPGEHWLGICRLHGGRLMYYDSFGRKGHQVGFTDKMMTEEDAEQDVEEQNCGQRCIAWLRLADERGSKAARNI